jgi:hypothetical protein
MVPDGNVCRALNRNGDRCKATPLRGAHFCFFHAPGSRQQRKAARRAGGVGRSKPAAVLGDEMADAPLKSIGDVVTLLGTTINHVLTGRLDPRIGNSVGYLAGVILRGLEQNDIEKRLACLEAAVRERSVDPGSIFNATFDDCENRVSQSS